MKIYTKKGDLGETEMLSGERLPKSCPRVKAFSSIDELNSLIGIAILYVKDSRLPEILKDLQNDLFVFGAHLSSKGTSKHKIQEEDVTKLEKLIDQFTEKLAPLNKFILPGGSLGGSHLHLARAVCRRAETDLSETKKEEQLDEILMKYLNRLSDFLFTIARLENQFNKVKEINPKY
ncbi:MAG TPA: cob(I)yrinic acid a,c-diamide adenosyltransferase [archaeon]|nr:cob(I)yrinic acid a,c-diamide adenosyltransferase [archaeon]